MHTRIDSITIFWDQQDEQDAGWAYRVVYVGADGARTGEESGGCYGADSAEDAIRVTVAEYARDLGLTPDNFAPDGSDGDGYYWRSES